MPAAIAFTSANPQNPLCAFRGTPVPLSPLDVGHYASRGENREIRLRVFTLIQTEDFVFSLGGAFLRLPFFVRVNYTIKCNSEKKRRSSYESLV